MLATHLITTHYPAVTLFDKVSLALQLMDDFDIHHLPVTSEEKFLGLVSKDDLMDADENAMMQFLEEDFIRKAIKGGEHFFSALKMAAHHSLSLVPVVNDSFEWVGGIPADALLKAASEFMGTEEPGGVVVLEMERKNYSFGEISRLVETNDAHITQLNTSTETQTGLLLVTVKINKTEVSDIIATFQSYEYSVRYFIGEEEYENELRYNYDHLMSYLKM